MLLIKAVIFDFDGTLADTLPVCFYAFQSVFKEFDGIEIDSDQIKAMFGPSETGIIRNNLLNKKYEEAIELYYKKYSEKHCELVANNEEINDLLGYLKKDGFLLGIVTGKARRSLDISLKILGMNHLFDCIVTGDDVKLPKPHPEGINKVLQQLNIHSSEAIFIGDSDADIQAGIDANVYTLGVQWLESFQTSDFTFKPKQVFKSINKFKNFMIVNSSTMPTFND